jgi:hypothetical protein
MWLKVTTAIFIGLFMPAAVACDIWPAIVPFWVMRTVSCVGMLLVILVCPMRPQPKLWHRFAIFAALLVIIAVVGR